MRIIFCILILFIALDLMSQEVDSKEIIIDPIEYQAEFPGGNDSLWCFFESNIDYNILNTRNLEGRIITIFVIDTFGRTTQIKTNPEYSLRFKDIIKDSIIENEIKRVIALMPVWKPATQLDKKVRMQYSLQIIIPYTMKRCLN